MPWTSCRRMPLRLGISENVHFALPVPLFSLTAGAFSHVSVTGWNSLDLQYSSSLLDLIFLRAATSEEVTMSITRPSLLLNPERL